MKHINTPQAACDAVFDILAAISRNVPPLDVTKNGERTLTLRFSRRPGADEIVVTFQSARELTRAVRKFERDERRVRRGVP